MYDLIINIYQNAYDYAKRYRSNEWLNIVRKVLSGNKIQQCNLSYVNKSLVEI